MNTIVIIARLYCGAIKCIIYGDELIVPDDMTNRHRYMIWDEWEMCPPDPVTGERVQVNFLPPAPPMHRAAPSVETE